LKPNPANLVSKSKRVAFATTRNRVWKVAGYRLYGLDGVSKVASADWIEADDDDDAIAAARERHDGRECELWQGRRLVARLDLRGER
jgi:hypothetical protein